MTITNKHLTVLVFILIAMANAGKPAAGKPTDLHAEIAQTYNFQPHALDKKQIQEKSAMLDQFWSKAKLKRDVYVLGLRKELADFSNPPFFLYDGSKLLLSLSNEPADRKIVLAAIAHSNLRDLQLKDYFMLVHGMAAQGEDTTVAAFHILEEPKFRVIIPQHALTLAQDYSLVYMLLPTDQSFWLKPAVERLRNEKDETAQKSLLLLLWYAQTADSDNAIEGFLKDPSKSAATRTYALDLAHRKDKIGLIDRGMAIRSSEESLRSARRERMKAVSDEALYDLDEYTAKIIAKR